MGTRQFYMTLPSNSSLNILPNNTLTEYKVKLPEHVNLIGTWDVGLASITFPHTWYILELKTANFITTMERVDGWLDLYQ